MHRKTGYHHKNHSKETLKDMNLIEELNIARNIIVFYRRIKKAMYNDCSSTEIGYGRIIANKVSI